MQKLTYRIKIALVMIGLILIVQWIVYIHFLRTNEYVVYSDRNQSCVMTSANEDGIMVMISGQGNVRGTMISSDTVVYRKTIYQYWDFPLIWGDYSCVDYEFHFLNVNTGKEEVYRIKPYADVDMYKGFNVRVFDSATCYIVNGEKKLFFRYVNTERAFTDWPKDKREDIYGAYISNFDTKSYDCRIEDTERSGVELVEMAINAEAEMNCTAPGALGDSDFCRNNGIVSEDNYLRSSSSLDIQPCLTLGFRSSDLPEQNEALYSRFPDLEEYVTSEHDRCYIEIYFPEGFSPEEMAKMLIEDGQELTYEDVRIDPYSSVDGKEHFVSSYEECMKYYDGSQFLYNRSILEGIWPSIPFRYSPRMDCDFILWSEWLRGEVEK